MTPHPKPQCDLLYRNRHSTQLEKTRINNLHASHHQTSAARFSAACEPLEKKSIPTFSFLSCHQPTSAMPYLCARHVVSQAQAVAEELGDGKSRGVPGHRLVGGREGIKSHEAKGKKSGLAMSASTFFFLFFPSTSTGKKRGKHTPRSNGASESPSPMFLVKQHFPKRFYTERKRERGSTRPFFLPL